MKFNLLRHLPTFHGEEDENPYTHISDFKAICRVVQRRGAFTLFPLTSKDKAKSWLSSMRSESIFGLSYKPCF